MENTIKALLEARKKAKQYTELSLSPPYGDSTIRREGNRMFVGGGSGEKKEFIGVSEEFYDDMVNKYDSRVLKMQF